MEVETSEQFVAGGVSGNGLCSYDTMLSFSCRGRAESFARKLQLKLKNLGVVSGGGEEEQKYYAEKNNNEEKESSEDSDCYFDFGSPGSPTPNHAPSCDDLCCNTTSASGGRSCQFESGCVVSPRGNNTAADGELSSSDDSVYYDLDSEQLPLSILIQSASLEEIGGVVEEEEVRGGVVEGSGGVVGYESVISEVESEEFERPRIQRSSSLKTGKTPPGTPGRKKIVRFADVLGLDLADVRTFLDEIPNVPKSAFSDLKEGMEERQSVGYLKPSKTLLPSFHQPVSMPDYFDKIREQKVLLENAFLVDNFTIKGTVRVMNMDFHKSVYIRYSYNDWTTFTDFMTSYVSGSCDGFSDKFEFTIPLSSNSVEVGGRVSFACRFHCQGQQFWDNNTGRNYVFHCVPSSSQGQQNHLDFHLHAPPSWATTPTWM